MPKYVTNDGGRSAAGFKGNARDCVLRSICIALKLDYKTTYKRLTDRWDKTPRNGCNRTVYWPFLERKGWAFHATINCHTDNMEDHIPRGRVILSMPRHYVACINHVIHDAWDSRTKAGNGRKALKILGYWIKRKK